MLEFPKCFGIWCYIGTRLPSTAWNRNWGWQVFGKFMTNIRQPYRLCGWHRFVFTWWAVDNAKLVIGLSFWQKVDRAHFFSANTISSEIWAIGWGSLGNISYCHMAQGTHVHIYCLQSVNSNRVSGFAAHTQSRTIELQTISKVPPEIPHVGHLYYSL